MEHLCGSSGIAHIEDSWEPTDNRLTVPRTAMLASHSVPMTLPSNPRERTGRILASLARSGRPFGIRIPLAEDECR
jgi:hypothetical protein